MTDNILKYGDMVTINGVDEGLYKVIFIFEKNNETRINLLNLRVNNQGWVIPKIVNNLYLSSVTKVES